MKPIELREQIAGIAKANPDLSTFGWRFSQKNGETWNDAEAFAHNRARLYTADFTHQVATAVEALNTAMPHGMALLMSRNGSYGAKHKVESWVRYTGRKDLSGYISNGAMIVAAILCGWVVKRDHNSPNCAFRREVAK